MVLKRNTFKNSLVIGGLFISLLTACSASKNLEKELEKTATNNTYFMGLSVKNVSSGETIIDFQGNKYFTPASNVKLFTLYAALTTLKDSVPSFEYCKSGDSLIIRGTGDPTFLNDSLHANSIKFLKNKKVKLYFLDKDLDDDVYGAGWSWDDYQYAYMPEKNLMPLYGNTLELIRDRDSLQTVPAFFNDKVSIEQEYKRARDLDKNNFYISESVVLLDKKIPFKTSNQLVADLLSKELNVKVTLINETTGRKFKAFNEVLYDSLYVKMMKESDNFIAEQLMLQVGNKAVEEYNVSKGIHYVLDSCLADLPQRPRWVDGSGLSRYNLFSPQSIVYLLAKMYDEVPTEKLMSYFSQGGVDGTLKNDFIGQDYIRAKSGTLSNNYSLSGYLTTKKGNTLIFSYMNNHYPGKSSERKAEIATFLQNLHDHY